MTVKKLPPRLTKLLILLYLTLLPAAAFAAADINTLPPKAVFDCEQKAAAFTKELGQPGNSDIYLRHLQQCLDLVEPVPAKATLAAPRKSALAVKSASGASCTAADGSSGYLFTFKNQSGEPIWIGVWDTKGATGADGKKTGGGANSPAGWTNWKLDIGAENSWCAPKWFNGRFIVRARCDEKTGVCAEGNCCNPKVKDPHTCSSDMRCNIGAEPSSLAEFTFDDKNTTWYDVSYVDGYNFPVMIESNDSSKCATLGNKIGTTNTVGALPDCTWPTIDGVCLGPYHQYAMTHPKYKYEQDYYTLAAKCASPKENICGCGNQCTALQNDKSPKEKCPTENKITNPDGEVVTLYSSGCSPFNPSYLGVKKNPDDPNSKEIPRDDDALKQVVCDPLGDPHNASKVDCQQKWPEEYKAYVKAIVGVIPKAYTWQYHDDSSLTNCPTVDGQSFTVTVGARPANSKYGNAYALELHPGNKLTGTVTIDTDTQNFKGPENLVRILKDGAKVTLTSDCPNNETISCIGTYDAKIGLTYPKDFSVCSDTGSGFDWAAKDNVNTRTFSIGVPDAALCNAPNTVGRKFKFTPSAEAHGTIVVKTTDGKTKTVPFAKGTVPFNVYVDTGYQLTINNECSDVSQVSCNAVYTGEKGLVPSFTDANDPCREYQDPYDSTKKQSKSGIVWSAGNNRGIAFGPAAAESCTQKDKTAAKLTFYIGENMTVTPNGQQPATFKGQKDFYLHENDNPISVKFPCTNNATLSCKTRFDFSSKKLILNDGQSTCTSVANILGFSQDSSGTWSSNNANELRPGLPVDTQCSAPNVSGTKFGFYPGAPLSVSVNNLPAVPIVSQKDLYLNKDDKLSITFSCLDSATLNCTATFDASSNKLKLDGGQPKCASVANILGFSSDGTSANPNELRPGVPAGWQCK